MIVIDTFKASIPPAVGEGKLVQDFFLHWLFPASCLLPVQDFAQRRGGIRSYQLLAMQGYWAALRQENKDVFVNGCEWLRKIKLPQDLLSHAEALIGIALGVRAAETPELRKWYVHQVLPGMPLTWRVSGLSVFLEAIADWEAKEMGSTYTDEEYALAAPLCLGWASSNGKTKLADYLVKQRKSPFPYFPEDFVRTMLGVYVMDSALAHCLCDPEDLKQFKLQTHQKAIEGLERNLHASAQKTARRWVAAAAILLLLTTCALSALALQHYATAVTLKAAWEESKWIFLLWGGPLTAITYLVRLIWFWYSGKTLNGDYVRIAHWISERLHARWLKRLRLNASPDSTSTQTA